MLVSVSANNVGRPTNNSTGCSLCSDREVFKEITKKTIKDEILRKLGFSTAPNVTGDHLSKMHFVRKQIEQARKCVILVFDLCVKLREIPVFVRGVVWKGFKWEGCVDWS